MNATTKFDIYLTNSWTENVQKPKKFDRQTEGLIDKVIHIAVLVVNYGISNTIVLEIP